MGSTLIKAIAAILAILLAVLLGYAGWTVYENTLTTAARQYGEMP